MNKQPPLSCLVPAPPAERIPAVDSLGSLPTNNLHCVFKLTFDIRLDLKKHLAAFFAALAFTVCASATTIRVPEDQSTIQAGISAAVAADTILLSDGVYTGPGNRNIDFGGKRVVVRSENGPAATIIDCQGSLATPYRGFNFHSHEDSTAKVEGITIQNGFGLNDTPGGFTVGGAIRCDTSSSPIVRNCVIYGNTAQRGGGIYSGKGSLPRVFDCVLRRNSATFGAGVAVISAYALIRQSLIDSNSADTGAGWGGNNVSMSVIGSSILANSATQKGGGAGMRKILLLGLDSCTFADNHSQTNPRNGQAGGLSLEDILPNYVSTITNTLFAGNVSGYCGGIMVDTSSNLIIRHCRFESDSSGGGGGGIGCSGRLRIDSSTFEDNWAGNTDFGFGGAIDCINGMAGTIDSCTFLGNGAYYDGGGIRCRNGASPHISNCYFRDNHARIDLGGGIAMEDTCDPVIDSCVFIDQSNGAIFIQTGSSPHLSSCTIVGTSGSSPLVASAIWYQAMSRLVIDNTIIAYSGGPALFCNDSLLFPPGHPFSIATISCSDFYGNAGGDWTDSIAPQRSLRGNMSADPMFCDTSDGRFTLNSSSPCASIHSSCGALVGALGVGCCCRGTTGNVNCTGVIDLGDLSALVSYLTGGGFVLCCPEAANVNGIGTVDLGDLSALVNYMTGGTFALPSCP